MTPDALVRPRTRITAVHGTWSWHGFNTMGQWWEPPSPWWSWMAEYGCVPVSDEMFCWSGDVNGVPGLQGRRMTDWEAGAIGLMDYLRPTVTGELRDTYVPIAERNLFAHSHGGQVVILACAHGLKINRLITSGTPVRSDMEALAIAALPNIGRWDHVYAEGGFWKDRMQALGSVFDGYVGLQRAFKIPGVRNHPVRDIDHSKALHDRVDFQKAWVETGIMPALLAGGQG